jgi:hypothetical protein
MRQTDSTPNVKDLTDSPPCNCATCVAMCRRPCWPTPPEVDKLIDAGFGPRLMEDYWSGGFKAHDNDVPIICPANPGYEGERAGWDMRLGCVLQDPATGYCALHDLGLKPLEGRVAHHDGNSEGVHEAVARTWDTDEGRRVTQRWRESVGFETD